MSRFKKLFSFTLIAALVLGIGMLALPAHAEDSFFDQVLAYLQQIRDFLSWIVDLLLNPPPEPGTLSMDTTCENCPKVSIGDNRAGKVGIVRDYFLTVTGDCPVYAFTGTGNDDDPLTEVKTPNGDPLPYEQGYEDYPSWTIPSGQRLFLKCKEEGEKCQWTAIRK